MEPATALVTLLRQLGVPAERIPPELEHRAALWRAELAARRAVVVLDNAGSGEQLGPLLPSLPGSLVLVTSRRRLVAFDGAPPESLPVFSEAEAIELLTKVVGPDRVMAEPVAAALVVRRCGYLPLAIRFGWRPAGPPPRLAGGGPGPASSPRTRRRWPSCRLWSGPWPAPSPCRTSRSMNPSGGFFRAARPLSGRVLPGGHGRSAVGAVAAGGRVGDR